MDPKWVIIALRLANISVHLKSWWGRFSKFVLGLFDPKFTSDFSVRVLVVTDVILLALIWVFSIFSFTPTDYQVPLRYDSFLGVTTLGSWYQLYTVPAILLLLFLINLLLSNAAYTKDRLISYILLGTNIFLSICGATVVLSLSAIINR